LCKEKSGEKAKRRSRGRASWTAREMGGPGKPSRRGLKKTDRIRGGRREGKVGMGKGV